MAHISYAPAERVVRHARKTVAFTGAAGNGAVGTVNLFTITGRVLVHNLIAFCTEDLAEAAPTASINCGIATSAGALIANPTGGPVDIDANEWWNDASPQAGTVKSSQELSQDTVGSRLFYLSVDIVLTIGTQNVTDGTLIFDVWWEPVTDDGLLVAA